MVCFKGIGVEKGNDVLLKITISLRFMCIWGALML